MPAFYPKERSEYKLRISMSLGVLIFVGFTAFRTDKLGAGFLEIVLIGPCFSLVSIAHSGWAIWKSNYVIKEKGERTSELA